MKSLGLCFAALSMLTLSSCYYADEESLPGSDPSVKFIISYEGIDLATMGTRASSAPALGKPADLLVLDVYESGTAAQKTKPYTFTSLSSVDLPLSYGKHDLYFVAAVQKGTQYDMNNLTVSWPNDGTLKAVWAYHYQITVDLETTFEDITLPLVVADVRILTLDKMPSTLSLAKIEAPDVCSVLDLKTMQGLSDDNGYLRELNVQQAASNGLSFSLNVYTFVPADASVGDLHVAFYSDAEGATESFSKDLEDVPVTIGYVSNYTGYFFSAGINVPLQTTTDWLGVNEYTF